MPRMARRVVCGLSLVMATFSPTSAFVSVDLPTFGRPTNVTKPDRPPAEPDSVLWSEDAASAIPISLLPARFANLAGLRFAVLHAVRTRCRAERLFGRFERVAALDEHRREASAATAGGAP